MPKKPEENVTPEAPKKPTHGPKPEKGLGALKKPGVVKPGEQNPEADKPTPVITHRHEQTARVERDCTKCKHSMQVSETEWECIKERYFLNTLICFVPMDEEAVNQ